MTRARIDHPDLAFTADPKRGCADRPDLNWFPVRGDHAEPLRAICATCPQLEPCRTWGIRHEVHGIWGGTTGRERRRIRLALGITVETPQTNPVICGTEAGCRKHRYNGTPVCEPCRVAYNAASAARRERRRGAA